MSEFKLIPFKLPSRFEITGDVSVTESLVSFNYSLRGPMTELVIPEASTKPKQIAGLWEFTCFEAFISQKKNFNYIELNFSPSHDFDVLFFESYRKPIKSKPLTAPKIVTHQSESIFELQAEIDRTQLKTFLSGDQSFEMAISAVLENRDNSHSFWALSHSGLKPDFHLRADFLLKF